MHPLLATRLFNRPLALARRQAEALLHGDAAALRPQALATDAAPAGRPPPYAVVEGVAIIEVQGLLMQRAWSWWFADASYEGIRAAFAQALADPAVRAVALDLDSPGGEVAGCFDLADAIYAARGTKPVWAILGEDAYSAAYALASAADRITVPRTGGTGSVGVITMHADLSRMLDQAGVAVTIVSFGERKADYAPSQPLSDAARARLQADVDAAGELFVQTVARNRGLSPDAVRATEAGTFQGAAGVAVGFADAVLAPDQAFAALLRSL